jgi:hypothetical protein
VEISEEKRDLKMVAVGVNEDMINATINSIELKS